MAMLFFLCRFAVPAVHLLMSELCGPLLLALSFTSLASTAPAIHFPVLATAAASHSPCTHMPRRWAAANMPCVVSMASPLERPAAAPEASKAR